MLIPLLILLQAAPGVLPATAPPARPCRAMGPKGKLIDLPPAICEQSTWDNVRIPEQSPARGVSGTTAMAFEITAEGRVENCRVVGPSGNAELDAKACAITTEKGRYKPAVDAAGKPIRSPGQLKVTWRAPG